MKKKLYKILITDDVHPHILKGLEELGHQINYMPDISYDDIFDIIHEYDGIVINSKVKMTRELMGLSPKIGENQTKLRFIARLGSGLEIIDQIAAKENGISVFSAPAGNRNAVAEHAMGMLLALANKLIWADQELRNFHWDRESHRGWELQGKTVGIIGFGNNGSCFAEKLAGFGVKVLSYDKYLENYTTHFSYVEECDSIEKIQKNADIISLHVPLNTSTTFLIDQEFIEKCKDGVIIINSARGKNIKTIDLIDALESGKVGGACLDVFENEKPATFTEIERIMYQKLYDFRNVILSPHVAGWTVESKFKIADILLKQISKIDQ